MPVSELAAPTPSTLSIRVPSERDGATDGPTPQSHDRVSTASFNLHGIDLSSFDSDLGATLAATSPVVSPATAPTSPRLQRDAPKNFLAGFKSRRSPEQDRRDTKGRSRPTNPEPADASYRPGTSSMSKIYHLKRNPGSTPELNLVGSSANVAKQEPEVTDLPSEPSAAQRPPSASDENASQVKRKENKGFRNPLARSKSIRRDSASKARPAEMTPLDHPPQTAPLSQDWPDGQFLRAKPTEKRGKSADRSGAGDSEDHLPIGSREKSSNPFMMGGKQVMSRAKTGGGAILNRLGKIARSGSSHEKEVPDSEYVLKVINRPLVDQTRLTRISKSLESCRDKTEYWMPSLPWRCIDYLNLNCEHEGLYRVPGSTPEVKRWQRRFDTELDVDLLDETELYDPNTISSMLKSWLRDLPTELMPKTLQHALGDELLRDNPQYQRLGEPVPQKLRNALSLLPPFNYYLLFAITCHLSLLLSHRDKNKMDLNNLSICIGPPLDLERWLFNYLVGDWRNCWQGCFTEPEYRDAERDHANGLPVKPFVFPEAPFNFDLGPGASLEEADHARVIGSVEATPALRGDEDEGVARSGGPVDAERAAGGGGVVDATNGSGPALACFAAPESATPTTMTPTTETRPSTTMATTGGGKDADPAATAAGSAPSSSSPPPHRRVQSEIFSLPIMTNAPPASTEFTFPSR